MLLHRNSGRWQLGLTLALVTALLWGTTPNILALALQIADTYTLTWFRFTSSFILLGLSLMGRQISSSQPKTLQPKLIEIKSWRQMPRSTWLLLTMAILGIGLDYPLYLMGMAATSPANAEVVIQLAPVLMGLGAIVIFKERYTPNQWIGVGILTAGFGLFFHEQLQSLFTTSSSYLFGSGLVMLAAISWAAYALAQKQLLQYLSSEIVMLIIYGGCALLYLPLANFAQLQDLTLFQLTILLLCGFSTLISYGAFAESLQHWEASKISAVQSLTPVITIATSWLLAAALPQLIAPAQPSWQAFIGAVLVITGSMLIALGHKAQTRS
jgi:drug/metabolite transporter (DMT)-like permease